MIEGKRVMLRAPEMDDIPVIYRWENDKDVQNFSSFKVPVSSFAIEQYIINADQNIFAAGELRLMAVTKNNPGEIVGHVDLFDIDPVNRRAGVGILVDNEFRGKGYASEMLALIEKWSIENLFLHQLWCTIDEMNNNSIKLFSDAGYQQTGKRVQWKKGKNKWCDEVFMQKILED